MTLDDGQRESGAITEGEQIDLLDAESGAEIVDVVCTFDGVVRGGFDTARPPVLGARSHLLVESCDEPVGVDKRIDWQRTVEGAVEGRLRTSDSSLVDDDDIRGLA